MNKKKIITLKAKEIMSEALIRPLTMKEVRDVLEIDCAGEDVCPNCGSPNFMSGELKTFDFKKEWYRDGDSDDTYVFVCCDCDIGRFDEPAEREEFKFWYVRDFWSWKMTDHGEAIYCDDSGYVWQCKDDYEYYEAPVWKSLAIEMLHITHEWEYYK